MTFFSKKTRRKCPEMDDRNSLGLALGTENGVQHRGDHSYTSPIKRPSTVGRYQELPDTDTETVVDEMERTNKSYVQNETFTLSPPQDVPVRDTGLEYTPQRKIVREKSRSCGTYTRDRLRFDKKRYSYPIVPVLDLGDMDSQTERYNTVHLNANQNSVFASLSKEDLSTTRPHSAQIEKIQPAITTPREKHSASVANCLFDMWQSQRICDVVLKIAGQEFPAHKLAIAAHSKGFANKFCNVKTTSDVCQVSVPNCSLDAAQQVLKYIYTSEINLTMQNIDSVLNCAKYLGITDIVEDAKQILRDNTSNKTLEVMKIARKHELLDIFSNVYDYVCCNFKQVMETVGFLRSSPTELCRLLSDDNLNVQHELDVFFAAMKWIDFNRQDRLQYIPDVLGTVRFIHISPEDIVNYVEPNLLLTSDCKDILMDVFRYQALKYSGSPMLQNSTNNNPPQRQYHPRDIDPEFGYERDKSPVRRYCNTKKNGSVFSKGQKSTTRKATPIADIQSNSGAMPIPPRPPVMVASGGVDPFTVPDGDAPSRLVAEYNPYRNSWSVLTRLPDARHHHGSAVLDDHIYVIGGSVVESSDPCDLANPTNICYRYDATGNFWTKIASMIYKRMYHGVAVLCGVLYAVGGQNEHDQSMSSVEYYNPDTDRWGEVYPMSEAKIGASTAGHLDLVYVVGGFLETAEEKVVLGTVECYDPRKNRWHIKNPLPGPRCHAGMVEVKGTLYLVGGSTFYDDSDAITSLDAVLRLDDNHDRWDVIQTLRVPRHDAGISVIGNSIYIVGGVTSSDSHALADVEVLDVTTLEWVEGIDWLTHPALGISCCTLEANPVT